MNCLEKLTILLVKYSQNIVDLLFSLVSLIKNKSPKIFINSST